MANSKTQKFKNQVIYYLISLKSSYNCCCQECWADPDGIQDKSKCLDGSYT